MSAATAPTAGMMLSVHLDRSRIGCGLRRLFLLKAGRRLARLLYVPTLTALTLPSGALAAACIEPLDRRRLGHHIRRTLKARRRLGLPVNHSAARRALALLGAN